MFHSQPAQDLGGRLSDVAAKRLEKATPRQTRKHKILNFEWSRVVLGHVAEAIGHCDVFHDNTAEFFRRKQSELL